MQGKDHRLQRLGVLTLAAMILLCSLAAVAGAAYPDTFQCKEVPTFEFPSTVTLGNNYFFLLNCGSIGTQAGDFVSVDVTTAAGTHILDFSKYEITDAGVEWISPLSDTNGNAWGEAEISPGVFDCNSTGVPYEIHAHWDGHFATQDFVVVCPTIDFDYYRIEVPNWEALRVTAAVTDNRGYAMRNIPCTASVLDVSTDGNFTTIKQEQVDLYTDASGKVRYQIETGLLHDLLQGYDYSVSLECLGGDGNFSFTIEEMNDQNLRNPVYFTIVFLSDNIIPIVLAIMICAMAFGTIYFIIKKTQNN